MHYSPLYPPSKKSLILLVLTMVALLALVVLNKLIITETGLLQEGVPLYSAEYLWCSALILTSSLLLCGGIVCWRGRAAEPPLQKASRSGVRERVLIAAAAGLSLLFLSLFLLAPKAFNELSMEDGMVEWASAFLLLGASGFLLTCFFKLKHAHSQRLLLRGAALLLAVLFFLIGMEEISWGQRVIGFETSSLLEANVQGEMNLHNLATEPVEIAYFWSAFVLTVMLPFMRAAGAFRLQQPYVQLWVPRPFIAYIGAISCAYNFDMWNIFLFQMSFYVSCLVLLYFMLKADSKEVALVSGAVLVLVVLCQAAFLLFADRYAREWELNEYKELMMPLAFFAYALDVFYQVRHRQPPDSTAAVEA